MDGQTLTLGKRIAQGSNKEVYEVNGNPSLVAFRFTDRVSVFDYGALPELIPNRGDNLMRFALAMQKLLIESDIPSAFEAGPSAVLQSFVMRKAGGSKWSMIKKREELSFVPLELVFRWGVPRGSSLLKRDANFKVGQKFEKPLIDFYTKLEDQDRLLDAGEAQKLLSKGLELESLTQFTARVAEALKKYFDLIGLTLWDGKIEVAVDSKGALCLVDAITPDELRLTMPGRESVPLSKELLRFWLSKSLWTHSVDAAKKRGSKNWRSDLPSPPRLNMWRLERVSKLYEALADTAHKEEISSLRKWAFGEDHLPKVYVAGNGGREAAIKRRLALEGVSLVDDQGRADAVFVSTDGDLANGKVNELNVQGLWSFGPTREAARIEWSKENGREVARQAGIAIPQFQVVKNERELEKAVEHFKDGLPVVKFDGLAAGKGVVLPSTHAELLRESRKWLLQGSVLLEERLQGFEASIFFAINSAREIEVIYLGSAQDFKRRYLGNEGPNTGGMGAYAPHPKVSKEDVELFTRWARSTAEVLREQKRPFNGILYLGVMKDEKKGWHLIEYNARLGDPETQALFELWDPSKKLLRYLMQLDIDSEVPENFMNDKKSLCLALVRKEYPDPAPDIEFPEWSQDSISRSDAQTILFENESKKGRVGYLVAADSDLLIAGDRVFKVLVESPWKDLVEWRSDILR